MALEEFTEEWQAYINAWEAAGGNFRQLIIERSKVNAVTVIDVSDDGEEEVSIFY